MKRENKKLALVNALGHQTERLTVRWNLNLHDDGWTASGRLQSKFEEAFRYLEKKVHLPVYWIDAAPCALRGAYVEATGRFVPPEGHTTVSVTFDVVASVTRCRNPSSSIAFVTLNVWGGQGTARQVQINENVKWKNGANMDNGGKNNIHIIGSRKKDTTTFIFLVNHWGGKSPQTIRTLVFGFD